MKLREREEWEESDVWRLDQRQFLELYLRGTAVFAERHCYYSAKCGKH